MRPRTKERTNDPLSERIRDAALVAFRGRLRGCRQEWTEIMGVPFPRLVVGDLRMVMSTPFQRLDRLVCALDLPHVAPVPRYSLHVWWSRKVYRATWNGDDDLKTHKLDRGP